MTENANSDDELKAVLYLTTDADSLLQLMNHYLRHGELPPISPQQLEELQKKVSPSGTNSGSKLTDADLLYGNVMAGLLRQIEVECGIRVDNWPGMPKPGHSLLADAILIESEQVSKGVIRATFTCREPLIADIFRGLIGEVLRMIPQASAYARYSSLPDGFEAPGEAVSQGETARGPRPGEPVDGPAEREPATTKRKRRPAGRRRDEDYDRAYKKLCAGEPYDGVFEGCCKARGYEPDPGLRKDFESAMRRRGWRRRK